MNTIIFVISAEPIALFATLFFVYLELFMLGDCVFHVRNYIHTKQFAVIIFFSLHFMRMNGISRNIFSIFCVFVSAGLVLFFVSFVFFSPVPHDLNGVNGISRMGFRFQELRVFSLNIFCCTCLWAAIDVSVDRHTAKHLQSII